MANEKRLIDANGLLETASGVKMIIPKNCHPYEAVRIQGAAFKEAVEKAPTIDAVEVVHGRWKYYHKQNKAVCTNCSFERDLDTNFGKAVSCPNCGAKMDGDGNDAEH